MPGIARSLLALSSLLLAPAALAQPVPTISIPGPVAPALEGPGQGMCMASAVVERNAQGQFEIAFGTLDDTNYNPTVNSFLEQHQDERVEYSVRSPLDLSNNNLADPDDQTSLGDFRSVSPTCPEGGCGFFINDTTTAFTSRLRGFFNVTSNLAGQTMHIGFYADDAVSLTIYNKDSRIFEVMKRPPQIGSPTWRLTQAVRFEQPGLYPVEVVYAQITEHSALEMSFFLGTFQDFEREAAQDPVVQLDDASFAPFQPVQFFQAISGAVSFPDPDQCLQCNRQFVGMAGNNGCPGGYYCNEAALCAPCDTALFCGPSCSPCGGTTQFCINRNGRYECAECEQDSDCRAGYECDPDTNTCVMRCHEDADCVRGKYCDLTDGECKWCDQDDQCAGNSCNCCPTGSFGPPMRCEQLTLTPGDPPVCVECVSDDECPDGKQCDLMTGLCVEELLSPRAPSNCGSNHEVCPPDRPFCIGSPKEYGSDSTCVACLSDLDCSQGSYCSSGECQSCTVDKHCGPRCQSCGDDKPFCGKDPMSAEYECTRCTDDSQCGGQACDKNDERTADDNTCASDCLQSCAEGLQCIDGVCTECAGYVYDDRCVTCYVDSQCGCEGICSQFECLPSCRTNTDCQGTQHCLETGEELEGEPISVCGGSGPGPSDILCARPPLSGCGVAAGERAPSPWLPGLALVIGIAALRARRRPRRPCS